MIKPSQWGRWWLLLAALVGTWPGVAGEDDDFWQALVKAQADGTPLTMVFSGDRSQAFALQQRWLAYREDLGAPIGYKAALTSPPAQARFGVDAPLLGVLQAEMVKPSGSAFVRNFAAVPLVEADLVVEVGNAAINQASTPAQALAALNAVYPFIELPDLVYQPGLPLDGPSIIAINTGARAGVIGKGIPLDGSAWQTTLLKLRVTLYGDNGKVLGSGVGRNLLGDPLLAVLWIRDAVHARGGQLRPGDMLSLGSLTPPQPLGRTTQVTAVYEGLTAAPITLTATFTDH